MFYFSRNKQYQYEPVNGGSRIRSHYKCPTILVTAALVLASAITGFYAGRLSVSTDAGPAINCMSFVESARVTGELIPKQSIHSKGNLPL